MTEEFASGARRSGDLKGERWDLISGVVTRPLRQRLPFPVEDANGCTIAALEAIDAFIGCIRIDPDLRIHYIEKALGLIADAIELEDGGDTKSPFPYAALRRLARTCHEGAVSHGAYNWLKGFPVWDVLNHAKRHLVLWLSGDRADDHLGHAMWGMMATIHFWLYRPDLCTGFPNRDYSYPGDLDDGRHSRQ